MPPGGLQLEFPAGQAGEDDSGAATSAAAASPADSAASGGGGGAAPASAFAASASTAGDAAAASSSTRGDVPIVFLHGVGFGVLPYLHLVRQLQAACGGTPVMMVEVRSFCFFDLASAAVLSCIDVLSCTMVLWPASEKGMCDRGWGGASHSSFSACLIPTLAECAAPACCCPCSLPSCSCVSTK
jgi:hypothetical protein